MAWSPVSPLVDSIPRPAGSISRRAIPTADRGGATSKRQAGRRTCAAPPAQCRIVVRLLPALGNPVDIANDCLADLDIDRETRLGGVMDRLLDRFRARV